MIIEGETGVGKTALVEMLSILWNQSLLGDWRLLRDRVLTQLQSICDCELSRCMWGEGGSGVYVLRSLPLV